LCRSERPRSGGSLSARTHRGSTDAPNDAGLNTATNYYILPVSGRYYRGTTTCPDDTMTDCTVTSDGDPNLPYEHIAEQVVGVSTDLVIEYLAEPASAGSFTAWVFGAPEGLSAGYHVFRPAPSDAPISLTDLACLGQATDARSSALRAQFGDEYDLSVFPYVRGADGSISPLPAEVKKAGAQAFCSKLDGIVCRATAYADTCARDGSSAIDSDQPNRRSMVTGPVKH
jgi:hypothetical protein